MHELLRSIGAVARESGLSASALRFYDAAGVLCPTWTDPVTGYRWYAHDQVDQARLIHRLRQVELPLAEIARVLESRHRPADAAEVLDRHERALTARLAAAREQLSDARRLVTDPPAARFELSPGDLGRALAAVRYALGSDPAWPALTGVLLDCSDGALRLVACDRFRLATVSVRVRHLVGSPVRFVAPLAALESLPDDETLHVELRVDRAVLGRSGAAEPVVVGPLAAAYPDYRSLLRASWVREARILASDLVSQVLSAERAPEAPHVPDAASDVVAVVLRERTVDVVRPTVQGAVPFDRRFLLEALAALDDEVVLALDATRQVLSMARSTCPDDASLLMPVRLGA